MTERTPPARSPINFVLDASEAGQARRLLEALPIAVDPAGRKRDLRVMPLLARTRGLTAYLEMAVRLGVPLATLDGALPTRLAPLLQRPSTVSPGKRSTTNQLSRRDESPRSTSTE